MSLITCSECGKIFSDKAAACPNCACPTELVVRSEKIADKEDVVELCETENALTNPAIAEEKADAKNELEHTKENLLSFQELKDFCFSSMLPYIGKDLEGGIEKVNKGRGVGDVDYFITDNEGEVIGIRVIIDVYPDIYNVGRLFGEDKEPLDYAKAMYEEGYDFAVARIGIGAADANKFDRRVLLKNDKYYFNYKELQFLDYGEFLKIRFSLSEESEDESWKDIAGFEYVKPQKESNVNESIVYRGPDENAEKRRKAEAENWEIWKSKENYENVIRRYFEQHDMSLTNAEFYYDLFEFIAALNMYKASVEEIADYFFNAIDYVNGMFLQDSPIISDCNIIAALKAITKDAPIVKNHETKTWAKTAYDYLVYKYMTDRKFVFACIEAKKDTSDKNARVFGMLADEMQRDFRKDPRMFGYDESVEKKVKGLQEKNSSEYFRLLKEKRSELRKEMYVLFKIHERVVNKKKITSMANTDISKLQQCTRAIDEMEEFISQHFDEKLGLSKKAYLQSIIRELEAGQSCIDHQTNMIKKALTGNVGFWEYMKDQNEARTKIDIYSEAKKE